MSESRKSSAPSALISNVAKGAKISPRRLTIFRCTLALVVLGIIAPAVRYFLNFPLWGDEAFVAVEFVDVPGIHTPTFSNMLNPTMYGQIVPLGYMWATLALSKWLGNSELILRLPAFAAAIASLLLFWRFTSRTIPSRGAMLAVGFLAAAYYPIRHATEVKPYSCDLLISIVFLMLGWAAYNRPRSIGLWAALIAFAPLAIWSSYPAVFVGGGVAILLAQRLITSLRARQDFTPVLLTGWLLFGASLAASFIWMYLAYAKPHREYAAGMEELEMWRKGFPPIAKPWNLPLWLIQTHAGNMLAYPIGGKNGASSITLICVIAGCIKLWRINRPLLLLLLSPAALNLIAAAFQRYPYGGTVRTSMFLAPSICLLAGLGLALLISRFAVPTFRWLSRHSRSEKLRAHFAHVGRPHAFRVAAGFMAVVALGSVIRDLTQPYKKEANFKCREVVAATAAKTKPTDQWVVFNSLAQVPYAPYIAPWKGDGAQFIYYATRLSPAPILWSPPPANVKSPANGATWVLAYRGANFPFSLDQFAAYTEALKAQLGPHKLETVILQKKVDRTGNELDWQVFDVLEFRPG